MKNYLYPFVALALCTGAVRSQIQITPGVSATTLMNGFVGSGISVSNVVVNCPTNAYGTFTNGNTTNIGLTNGALFTNGDATAVAGPNNSGSYGQCNGTSAADPNLITVDASATEDPCIVEFDLVPQCNQLAIRFVFGSEEYPEFVGAGYNDAFGFFVSGPGPACQAGYYNGQNIATLPNNTTPVTISNINGGSNSSFYVNNNGGSTIQYDGFTTVLTRTLTVCPCQTYHFKIAVADAGDCFYDSGVLVDFFQCNNPLSASVAAAATSCGLDNGSAVATPTGVGPFTYSWSPAPGTGQNTASASSMSAGTYTLTVNDALSCTAAYTTAVNIGASSGPSATASATNVSCNGGTNGTATVLPGGGTPPYTYSWSPSGGTGITASNRPAGTYTCTVTDANACVTTATVSITQPAAISSSVASFTDVACNGGNNGSATVSISGGTPGYTYSWLPSGGTAATASSLAAGTYTCTITDANSCTATQTVSISQPTAISSSVSSVDVSCEEGNNGSATVSVSGGTPGYTYSWAPSGGTAATAGSLAAGTYTCTITDANSCLHTQTVSITQPTAISTSVSSISNVACNGAGNGSVTVSAGGGTPGYMYSWAPSGGTAATASSLTAGTYTCTITDANNCTATQTVLITEPALIMTAQSFTLCAGNSMTVGSSTYSVSGVYTDVLTAANGCDSTVSTDLTILPLNETAQSFTLCAGSSLTVGPSTYSASGVYTDVLTAANGCDSTLITHLTIESAIDVSTAVTGETITAGATGASYQWIDCGNGNAPLPGQNGSSYTATANGDYAVVVTVNSCSDTSGCVSIASVGWNAAMGAKPAISVYPNPSSGLFTITGLETGATIDVYTTHGELVKRVSSAETTMLLNLTGVKSGMYILRIRNVKGELYSVPLIRE